MLFPIHCWTWQYVLKECWRAAALVGGRLAIWKTLFVDFLAFFFLKAESVKSSKLLNGEPPYSATNNYLPAFSMSSSSGSGMLKTGVVCAKWSFDFSILCKLSFFLAGTTLMCRCRLQHEGTVNCLSSFQELAGWQAYWILSLGLYCAQVWLGRCCSQTVLWSRASRGQW